jgi:hypothetical protein
MFIKKEYSMKSIITCSLFIFTTFFSSLSLAQDKNISGDTQTTVWNSDSNIELFWQQYTESKGGLTWGKSSIYPEYEKVSEGDTFLVQLTQGPCLMEFFHSRWRRASEVRRWDDSINSYGGCPYVFD